jgi:hypothetical protein
MEFPSVAAGPGTTEVRQSVCARHACVYAARGLRQSTHPKSQSREEFSYGPEI